MDSELPYVTALVLGSLHAFEVDHMAAVTSFAVQKPAARSAVRFGFQWAVGHGSAILLAGALLIFLGLQIPDAATSFMERVVGLALMALGLWTLRATRVVQSRAHTQPHSHARAPTLMGLLHGLAGATPAVALVPLALFDTALGGLSYLLLFATGTAVSMSVFAVLAGFVAGRASHFAAWTGRAVAQLAGVSTLAIGVFWLTR